MSVAAWRIVKARHASRAFDGEGARRAGGRWNSPGTRLVYASATASLAILELLVHLESQVPLAHYTLFEVRLREAALQLLDRRALAAGWRESPAPHATRTIGDRFAAERSALALRVPSVIVPHESNYLINPEHPDFRRVRIGAPRPFPLDERLRP